MLCINQVPVQKYLLLSSMTPNDIIITFDPSPVSFHVRKKSTCAEVSLKFNKGCESSYQLRKHIKADHFGSMTLDNIWPLKSWVTFVSLNNDHFIHWSSSKYVDTMVKSVHDSHYSAHAHHPSPHTPYCSCHNPPLL